MHALIEELWLWKTYLVQLGRYRVDIADDTDYLSGHCQYMSSLHSLEVSLLSRPLSLLLPSLRPELPWIYCSYYRYCRY